MSNELGAGLSLDEYWDLYVDETTGDLEIDEGLIEVRKDLAFAIGRALQDEVGGVMTDGRISDIELYVEKIVVADDRIDTVDSVGAQFDTRKDEVEIRVVATTVTGVTLDDVFTV